MDSTKKKYSFLELEPNSKIKQHLFTVKQLNKTFIT